MKLSIKTLQSANNQLKAETKSFSGALNLIKTFYMKEDRIVAKNIFPDKYSREWEDKAVEFLSKKPQIPTKNNPNGLSKYDLYKRSELERLEILSSEFKAHAMHDIYTAELDEKEKEKLSTKMINDVCESHVYKHFLKNKRFNFSPYGVGMLAHAMYNNENGYNKK